MLESKNYIAGVVVHASITSNAMYRQTVYIGDQTNPNNLTPRSTDTNDSPRDPLYSPVAGVRYLGLNYHAVIYK